MADLIKLAERCERAKGPDRELDERIGMAIGHKRTIRVGHECLGTDREVPVSCLRYTALIDAALTLMPEGSVFSIDTLDGFPEAVVGNEKRALIQADYIRASTPALALCAAALRARASQ